MDYSKLSDNTLKSLAEDKPLDYSKLSDDELQELSKPESSSTTEEIQSPSSFPSDIKDIGLGLVNPLGITDEAIAGLQAGGEKIKDLLTGRQGKDFLARYGELAEEYEKPFTEAQERSPWLFGAGQIAGSIVPGMLTGGAGLGVGISKKGLEAAGKVAAEKGLAEGLSKTAIQELAKKASGREFKKQLAKTTAVGALAGGISGAGQSQGDIRTEEGRGELLRDTLAGTALGGTLTPVLNVAGHQIGKSLPKLFSDRPEFRRSKVAYDYGKKGKNFLGDASELEILENLEQTGQGLSNKLVQLRNNLSERIGDVLGKHKEPLVGVQSLLELSELELAKLGNTQRTLLTSREYDRLNAIIQQTRNVTKQTKKPGSGTQVSAKEAFDLRDKLLGFINSSQEGDVNQIAKNLVTSIEQELDKVPGFTKALTDLKTIPTQLGEQFLGDTFQNVGFKQSEAGLVKKLGDSLTSSIESAASAGSSTVAASERKALTDFFNNLRTLNQKEPELLSKLGFESIDQLEKSVKNIGDLREVNRIIAGKTHHAVSGAEALVKQPARLIGLGSTTLSGIGLNLANRAGRVVGAVSNNPVTNFSRKLVQLPTQSLNSIAEQLQASPQTKAIGDKLISAIQNNDTTAKNAALFVIMQNPNLRDSVKSLLGMDEDGTE